MPQIINTNIASLNAQRNLDKSQSSNQQALQRLSSGLRINSAKDDAAGLAISTRFTSQIKGLNVAVRNAGDGIALAQTAEGALGSINENLQRVRELAVQSANATNSDVDRDALQAEVDQLVAEITRTSEETDFNGRKLLDGSFSATFQVGANAGQTVDVSIAELTSNKLGSSSQSGLSARGTDNPLENGDLVINGVAIAASRAEDDTSSVANNSASAISKAEAINRYSSETGVTAQVNQNVAGGSEMSAVAGSGTFTLNGVDISFSTTTDAAQTRAAISQAINAVSDQTGVKAVDTDSASTGVNLVADDGRNITLTFDTADLSSGYGATDAAKAASFASATGLAGGADNGGSGTVYSNTYEGGYTLIADGDQKSIDISGGNGTGRGDLANAGLTAGTYDRAVAASVSTKVSDTTQASTITGGSLSNAIARADSGGTLMTTNGGSITNLASSTATDLDITADITAAVKVGTTEFSLTDGAGDTVAELATALDAGAAGAAVDVSGDVNFFEKVEFNISTVTTGAGGGTLTLGGQALNLLDSTATGYTTEDQLVSLQNQINAADFSGTVGPTGSIVAELNEARDALSITVKNEGAASITAVVDATSTVNATLDGAGGSLGLTNATYTMGGNLAYEATGTDAVDVTYIDASTQLNAAGGTFSSSSVATAALTTTSEVDISARIGDSAVTVAGSPLAAGSSVAEAAAAVDAIAGVSAWEEISLTVDDLNLESGDTLVIGGVSVGISPDSAGNVNLASMVDDINTTDFSGGDFDVSASLNDAGDAVALTIRNFSGASLTIESENSDGRGISLSAPAGFVGEQAQTLSGELKFISDDGKDVSITMSDPTTGGEIFAGNVSSADFTGVNGLEDGDLLINGVTIGAADVGADKASATVSSDGSRILSSEKSQSAIAIASAINDVADETGVTASVNATEVVGGDGTNVDLAKFEEGDQAGIYINGVEVGTVTLQADGSGALDSDRARADALNLINQNAGKTGVTAVDNGVSLTLSAADGRNVSIAIDDKSGADASIGAVMGLDAAVDGIGEATFGRASAAGGVTAEGAAYETTYGTVKLSSASEFTLEGGANGNGELDALGLKTGTYGGGEDGQFLSDIDISTFEGATAAITAIDNAIGQVASQRADLGAIQNRLESTVSNLQVTSENLNSANSRIQDADFAAETAELSRTQVLQQAGISVLAQANAAGQQVLSLLG
ncbi:flagellin [Thalassolituus oleivorans]|uniref:flagellin N-terminal helical domain-containing protein n=1 Tax=Thalassolituus oleivorans TaxID=187493 RepID=UPI00042DBA48|nr:flagellin [Thalassolituus oleivorans]AHK15305.1 flagellin [Thalassolituus oleivorans R6-15]